MTTATGTQQPPQSVVPTAAAPAAPTIAAPGAAPLVTSSSAAPGSPQKTGSPRSSAGKKRSAPSSETAATANASSTSTSSTTTNNNNNSNNHAGIPPLHRIGKDGEPLSEKKLRRLEKNRLSARECRRRKREATENMQGQINQLEGENLRLRLQLQVGEEAEQTNHQKQIDSTKALDELLKSGKASESEIYAKIEEYKEKFADYGRDRRSAMEFHLRNVERLLMPTQTTSFIMNTLKDSGGGSGGAASAGNNQRPPVSSTIPTPQEPPPAGAAAAAAMAEPPKTSKELFTLLVKKLAVTPAQAAALKDSRFVAQEMDETLKETLNVLKELRGRLAQCGQDLETEFNCIRQILTPSQSAKFLVWVAQNKACMHMLNELWSKNYPSMTTTTTTTTTTASSPPTPTGSASFDSATE